MIALLAAAVLSQAPCAAEQAPGVWQKPHDELANIAPGFPKAKWPVLLAHSDQLIAMLKKALPNPVGLSAAPARQFSGYPHAKDGPVPHGLEVPFFSLYCDKAGKLSAEDETGTWVYIELNTLYWLANERLQAFFPTAGGATILKVPEHTEELHGVPVYKPHIVSGQPAEAVVFTRGGVPPYHLISRATYLEARIKAEKNDANRKLLEQALQALTEEERHKAAVVKEFNALPPKVFATPAEGGEHVATIEKKVFEPQGPREGIQAVSVYWSFDEKKESNLRLVRELKQNFDWEALKKMVEP
ncbi:MAG: hypothetical protein QM723_27120 [Myxococcaceae bacterium]